MSAYFVWLAVNGRLCAQVWHEHLVGVHLHPKTMQPDPAPLAKHELPSDEERWPIVRLASKYPAPTVGMDERFKIARAAE